MDICFAVSLRTVRPLVTKLWGIGKNLIQKTPAKSLVSNPFVEKTETAINKMTDTLISTMTTIRDRQLPKELKYLEKELEKIKDRISKTKCQ